MITASQIISAVMLLFSIAMLLVNLFTGFFKPNKFKKFFTATTIVYITGNILIISITTINKDIPVLFTIISEFTILCVYIFSTYMIGRLGRNMEDLREANINNDKTSEKEDN